MKHKKFFMGLLLIVQVTIIASSLYTFSIGHGSFLTWFNLILNLVFGTMNFLFMVGK